MILFKRDRPPPGSEGPEGGFAVGQLVRHRRYGYRGVVVAYDESCCASDEWYERNHTQPDRDQPWYHVLVDGTHQTTYAAQSSLLPEPTPSPVQHPWVGLFFREFRDGYYVRNERPWPGGAP